jgi:hypothetical protein
MFLCFSASMATGATGTANATGFADAVTALSSGGQINVGPGTFELNTVTLTSGITIQGAGIDCTIFSQGTLTGASYGVLYANSGSSSAYVENLTLRDFTIKCTAGTFSEHAHLLSMNGVRNLLIERVKFQGFQGDGLYLGSGVGGSDERHNINIIVRDCIFEGVNNENRAGISVIDGDGVLIDNCTFKKVTKSTMPGPFNMEPDANAFAIIKNVTIRNCAFNLCGGNVGTISMSIPSTVTVVPTKITIADNEFRSNDIGGAEIFIDVQRTLSAADVSMAVSITGNEAKGGAALSIDLRACKGVTIANDNYFQDYGLPAQIGFNGSTDLAYDIWWEPHFTRCSSSTNSGTAGVFIGKVFNLKFGGELYKCGGAAADCYPIRLIGSVTSDYVHFLPSLRVTLNTSQVNAIEATGHTQTPAHNRMSIEADLGGGVSEFTATAPGQRLSPATLTWDPSNLVDGAGETSSGVTVTGAAFGDTVVCTAPYDLQGITLTAYVSAADTVKARLQNETTATVNLASGIYNFTVTKKGA